MGSNFKNADIRSRKLSFPTKFNAILPITTNKFVKFRMTTTLPDLHHPHFISFHFHPPRLSAALPLAILTAVASGASESFPFPRRTLTNKANISNQPLSYNHHHFYLNSPSSSEQSRDNDGNHQSTVHGRR